MNYAKSGLDDATIRKIVAAVGSVGDVVNTRHAVAKERGWGEHPPSLDEFVREAVADPNLLRRPVFVRGKKVIVGYSRANAADWQKLAAE